MLKYLKNTEENSMMTLNILVVAVKDCSQGLVLHGLLLTEFSDQWIALKAYLAERERFQ